MASNEVTVHVTVCHCTEVELIERLTEFVAEHVASAREGVVPAILAEEIVYRLRAGHALFFMSDFD